MSTPEPTLPHPGSAALPQGGALPHPASLEQASAAAVGAPDVASIARLANAFFSALPTGAVPEPGAALGSAPLFAAEPLHNAIPGTPALSPSYKPNHNPGAASPIPTVGAARPSAPIFALDPNLAPEPTTAVGSLPQELKVPLAAPPVAPPPPSAPAVQPVFARDTDLAALPGRLDESRSFVPRTAWPSAGPFGADAAATAAPLYFLADNPALAHATPASAAPPRVETFDLTGLAPQHRPDVHVLDLSGARPFDANVFKRDFPILRETVNGRPLVWLDNGATTQKPQCVIDRLVQFYTHENSNIHRAAHTLAARSTDAYEAARDKVRGFINAPSVKDIVFVRGATEAINLVAQAWGRRNVGEGDEIVVSHLEHHANIVPWQQLAAEKGARLRVAPVDDHGQILLDEYEKLLGPKTKIVAFTQVSNALGTVTPVAEMTALAHRHGAKVLVDGAQGVCHMPVDVQALDVDFYAFSGHKMFAPTGIGVLYGKADVLEAMPPWQGGGNMIADVTFEKTIFQGPPDRFEAGTGNIADAVGLGAAIDYLTRIGMANIAAHEHELLAYGTEHLLTVPGLKLIGTAREKAGILSFVLDGCRSEDVGKALDREGIAVRAGHHCAQPILRRFGLESTVRPSLALYNTHDDIDALVDALRRLQSGRGVRA
ncbi:family 2A encapsulin nanocompartment cargo protein cysteine desulfurase [Rhodopseudomonas palustris]|uniref:family 2A encapsulin nanocompartment cargo protein cysteine desulfurase n=1 Tax=Rhodopseudomonas palustris TaxID=1076 RepID=UPI000D1B3E89|nr:family 2A encapsulin nanocompartment cargo protein cysteine desulfurase [Rhodopseudomonas palustris]AVT80266.1 segregation protein B [Rhodopseudomonas palustris]